MNINIFEIGEDQEQFSFVNPKNMNSNEVKRRNISIKYASKRALASDNGNSGVFRDMGGTDSPNSNNNNINSSYNNGNSFQPHFGSPDQQKKLKGSVITNRTKYHDQQSTQNDSQLVGRRRVQTTEPSRRFIDQGRFTASASKENQQDKGGIVFGETNLNPFGKASILNIVSNNRKSSLSTTPQIQEENYQRHQHSQSFKMINRQMRDAGMQGNNLKNNFFSGSNGYQKYMQNGIAPEDNQRIYRSQNRSAYAQIMKIYHPRNKIPKFNFKGLQTPNSNNNNSNNNNKVNSSGNNQNTNMNGLNRNNNDKQKTLKNEWQTNTDVKRNLQTNLYRSYVPIEQFNSVEEAKDALKLQESLEGQRNQILSRGGQRRTGGGRRGLNDSEQNDQRNEDNMNRKQKRVQLQSRGKPIATGLSGTSEPPDERINDFQGFDENDSLINTNYIQGEVFEENNDEGSQKHKRDNLNLSQPIPDLHKDYIQESNKDFNTEHQEQQEVKMSKSLKIQNEGGEEILSASVQLIRQSQQKQVKIQETNNDSSKEFSQNKNSNQQFSNDKKVKDVVILEQNNLNESKQKSDKLKNRQQTGRDIKYNDINDRSEDGQQSMVEEVYDEIDEEDIQKESNNQLKNDQIEEGEVEEQNYEEEEFDNFEEKQQTPNKQKDQVQKQIIEISDKDDDEYEEINDEFLDQYV